MNVNGWEFKTQLTEAVEGEILRIGAEPIMPEIGEMVKSLAGELIEKTLNAELQWSLMLVPRHTLDSLKSLTEAEVARRDQEFKEWQSKKENDNGDKKENFKESNQESRSITGLSPNLDGIR